MSSKSAYVLLQHKRHLFGIRTTPIMVFTDLVRARMEADLLKGSLPKTTFSVILAPFGK